MVRRMQITNAADRIADRLETKRIRRPWNPDLHPRDSKGRFVETGGVARLWGGGMARVLRALGGRNVLVENLSTRERSTIHASRLTMVARPDGTAPTKSKKKVRDEDERRVADVRRGRGVAMDNLDDDEDDANDEGDQGDTPDDPHDRDDEGNEIGEDREGEDLGAGPEPDDDDPTFRDLSRHTALPMNGGDPKATHVRGNGNALRAASPGKKPYRFTDAGHARAAIQELDDDYFQDLAAAVPPNWRNQEAHNRVDAMRELLDQILVVGVPSKKKDTESAAESLEGLSDWADDLYELADGDPDSGDTARFASNLSDAAYLAAVRLRQGPALKEPEKYGDHPRAYRQGDATPQPAAPARPKAPTPRRRDPQRRFKTLDDVRAHWASGNIRPFTTSERKQEAHNQAMPSLMDKLERPQLSRNGHFTIGKLPAKKPSDGPYGWAVTHNDTGIRLVLTPRKAEALDFANRLETAELNGKPVDWNDPSAFDAFRSKEGLDLAERLRTESQQAFADRAAKKRDGATSRTKPAPPTPESPTRAAQTLAARSGIPAANIGVGHVGAADNDPQRRPSNDDELRTLWANGGAPGVSASAAQHMKSLADSNNVKLHLSDHRGFAIVEYIRNSGNRFEVRTSGTGQRLMVNPIHSAGVFADEDTANRFALRLGSEIRDADGKTIDWGSPTLNLNDWRSKDGLVIRAAVLEVAAQFDVDRGAGDSDMVKRAQRVREYRQGQAEAAAGADTNNVPAARQLEDSPASVPVDASAADAEQTQGPEPAAAGGEDPVKTHLDRAAASLGPVMNELRDDQRWGQRLGRAVDQALGDDGDQDKGFEQLESVIEEGQRKLRSNRRLDSSERRYLDQHAAEALTEVREARKVAADRPQPPRPDGQRRPGTADERRPPSRERAIATAELDLAVDQLILAQRGTLQDAETSRGQIARAQALLAAVRDGETDTAADLGEILAEIEQGIRGRTDGLDESSKQYWLNELAEARQALMRAEARLGDIETTGNRRTPPADTGADGSEQVRSAGTDVLGDVPSGGAAVAGQRAGTDGVLRGVGQPDSGADRGSGGDAVEDDAAGDNAGHAGVAAAGQESGDGADPGRGALPAEGAGDGESGAGRDAAAAVDAARFRPGSQDDLAPSGERAKAKANAAAVRTLRRIQAENRPATPEEQQILARWSGWGSLPVVLSDKPNPNDNRFRDESGEPDPEAYARALKRWESFAEERAEIRELLDDKEWAAARKNTLNAHYTDSSLVQPVWDALRSLGFRRGRVLEPGSGSGNFIGHAPDGAEMVGVELDPTSAAISQLLYPDAQVINKPFQELRLPPDSFDLAIGNVPFGKYKLHDPLDNPGRHHSIHDHFILKSLARVRPGGYVALVTSRYTMDSEDDSARRAMYDMADLVGAVRLPEGAHQRAAGTHVVTDLLLFRRRESSDHTRNRGDDSWLKSSKTDIGGYEVPVNNYFQRNPKNVLGQMTVGSGQFTDHDLTVKGNGNTLVSMRAALGRIVADAKTAGLDYDASQQNADLSLNLAGDARDGSIARGENGSFMTVENGTWVELDVHPKQREQLGQLLHLKDLANRLVQLEASTRQTGETDEMREARAALNLAYDAYVRKHPSPNKPGQHRLFSPPEALARRKAEGLKATPEEWKLPTALALFEEDPDGHMVFGLDRWDADAKAPRKLNILSERVLQPREIPEHADTPELAVAYALEHDGGRLNLPTVARLLGMDQDAAREALGDLAFDDPATGRLEPRAAYLSGNVRQKLTEAQAAAAEDPKYAVNVAALERVVPKDIRPKDIRVKIGAPWVPIDIYEGFLRHLGLSSAVVTHHGGNRWSVDGDDVGEIAKKVWGVKGRSAYDIFDSLLHQKLITIKESQEFPDGSKKTFVNQKATSAARTKAKDMAREFQKWVMDDPERAGRLGRIYNDKFNSIALRDYDDSPLTLPGVRDGWRMRPHQNAAIRRITQEPTTLLGHVVGAGKTATMVGGAMELRRTGLAKKPAIVVPNHMLEQFSRETVGLYPGAKVLAISRKDLHHKKRRKFIAKIAGGDWDVVVLTHDAFNAMPMTPQTQQAYMDEELALLRSQIEKIKDRDGDDPSLKQMEQTLANQEEKLKERLETLKDQRGIFFENTGIDYLFVDEAHEYKNLRTVSNLPGAAISGSGQATQLHMALGYLREHNESGRVATLATGTPIANSVTEAYVLMRYLAPQILEDAGIEDFDSWAATFGEVVTSLELAPDGSGEYREKARFAKFFNVPELLVGYRTFADIQTATDLGLPTPPVRAGKNGRRGEVISIPASIEQRRYVESLADEDWIKDPGGVLKAIGFASRAAIDMRLQGGTGHEGGKLDAAAEQIAKLYEEHKDTVYPVSLNNLTPQETPGALQLVFLDEGTPGSTGKIKFDAYEALRDLLVEQGVPREKVRFIHEAKDDKAKAKLFEEARNGKVAVLIGSTQKMGTGTNVQDRAVALHHLSFPWRPADMEQRDGRIERQGNLNVPLIPSAPGMTPDDVRIMYYITEGTFDEFRLGTLERKAVFINQMARRDFSAREMEDIGDAAVSLGTFKAIASGNPAIAERAIAQAELVELQRQNADWYEQQQERRDRITYLTHRIAALEQALPGMREALAKRQDVSGDNFQASIDGVDYDSRTDAAEVLGRRMDAIAKDTRYGDGATVPLGEIGGVGFLAEVEYDRDGNRLLRLRLDHAPAYAHSPIPETRGLWSARKVSDSSGRGAIQSLENLLRSLDGDIEKREKELDGSRTARREAEEHLDEGTSPYEEQVESTERRMQALTELVMHHQEARKLTDRIKEATNADDASRLKKRLKEVQQETRTLESMAEQERAKTFTQPEQKPADTSDAPESGNHGASTTAAAPRRRPAAMTEQELTDELTSVETSIAKGDTDDAIVDRHAALTAERARRAAQQVRFDPQQVRSDLESLRDTSARPASDSETAEADTAPAPASAAADTPNVDSDAGGLVDAEEQSPKPGTRWKPGDWAVTPNGEGRVILAEDGEVVVLDGGGAPRTYEPRQLSLPGEARTAEHDAPTAQEAARQEKRLRDLEAAQSPQGLKLFYGSRLAHLNLEEGHGLILDEDGNEIGWVRRRGTTWLAQDSRGGLPQGGTAESAADPLLAPREAAQDIDGERHSSGGMRVPLEDTSWRHLRPEEGREAIWYSEFSDTQREEFFRLVKEWRESSDAELSRAAKDWGNGLNYQQMHRLADEFLRTSNSVDTSTTEGRRRQKVLQRTADKIRTQARRAWLKWQSMPPPGEPDAVGNEENPNWVPYGHRASEATTRADAGRNTPPASATNAPEREEHTGTPAAEPFGNDRDWRLGMIPLDAADSQIRREAGAIWSSDETPGGITLLGRAVLDALAAQEDGDYVGVEELLTTAREHAVGVLDTLFEDERTMEAPLRDFIAATDTYLARHRATVAQRRQQDAQRRDVEEQAGAQVRGSLRPAAAGQAAGPGDTTADEARESAPVPGEVVANAHDVPLLSFPEDRSGRAAPIREWAGVWAEPQPAGVRNVYLDQALAHNRDGWTASADPWDVKHWISTMADVEPLAQYDENLRRSLEEVPPEARKFLAGLAEELRSSVREMGEELRADIRPILMDNIATRDGRKKAVELRNQLVEERVQTVREAVQERIARARGGAAQHGLSEQQAEDFIVSVTGGDNPEQTTYGIRGEYPEAVRPLQAAVADGRAYWSAFAGWATQDDSSNWAGTHWENGRRESIGAPRTPFADPRTGTGDLRIGEAELPKGLRWVRGSELRKGDIFHSVDYSRLGTNDVFDGMEPPQYVVHLHRDGVEGAARSVTLDSGRGQSSVGAEQWVILVEKPEKAVRSRARHRARTDVFTNWQLPVDDETYELGGPDRVAALVARADVNVVEKDSGRTEWSVSVEGVEVGRITNDLVNRPQEYDAETPDGQRRTWHRERLATAALVTAHEDTAGREKQDDTRSNDANDREQDPRAERTRGNEGIADRQDRTRRGGDRDGDAPGRDGGPGETAETDAAQRDEGRRRRRDRDRQRPETGGGAPGGGRPLMPRVPDGRDRDDDDDRDSAADLDQPGRLQALLASYRSGNAPVPTGADPQRHAEYLRGLANNDSLTLSPGGGLITWTNTGATWRFGHAASGLHLEGWEVSGDAIGGREGARRLAGAYELLRDAAGELIDWSSPVLDPQQMRDWRDAEGRSLSSAVVRAQQDLIGLRQAEARDAGRGRESTAGGAARDGEDRGSASNEPVDTDTGAAATAAASTGASNTPQSEEPPSGEGRPDPDAATSQYTVNAAHGPQRAGTVDGRRIPTAKEMEQYESRGTERVISEEGERALFGSPEQMRALADEGFVPTPVMRSDSAGQVWRNGRLIGNLFAPHQHRSGHSEGDPEVWWSSPSFGHSLHFASREAAIAHLVLRDKERGEPDLSIVHPDLAWSLRTVDGKMGVPSNGRGLESLEGQEEGLERLQAIRDLLGALGRGETPSGNVADDLANLHDELRWLETHFNKPPVSLREANPRGPGWLADTIREYLDVLRPEDPRAQHHRARKNRAALLFREELLANGGRERAVQVPAGELAEGDLIYLEGRITGRYKGATDRVTGYVLSPPEKATLTTDGKKQKAWRIRVSPEPWRNPLHGATEGGTFIIPVTDSGWVLARAKDVDMPFDAHTYGRRVDETPGSDDRNTARPDADTGQRAGAADDASDPTNASPGTNDAADLQPPAGTATDTAPTTDADSSSEPSGQDEPSEPDAPGGDGAPGSRRKAEPAAAGEVSTAPATAPEPVGGRPAEWVKVSDLSLRDLVRIDGSTRRGTSRTLAGYVVDGPTTKQVTKRGRAQDMLRVLISDTPDGKGNPVWVMPDATAARATRDDADVVDGSPQTGADSDVLIGRLAERVPTDATGSGLFPGSVVSDDNGNEGVVTGASANSVRVQFGDDRTDADHAPTALSVTDGGAARPAGWTPDGHRVRPGSLAGDRDGSVLGTVEDVDGDTATVATPQGMEDRPVTELRVLRAVESPADQQLAKIERLERVPVADLAQGDVLIVAGPDGMTTAAVTKIEEVSATHTRVTAVDTTSGEAHTLDGSPNATYTRALNGDGSAAELGPEDSPSNDSITSHDPAPAVAPVTGPTVDPQLSPEEREAVEERGQAPTSAPEAQQAAIRVNNDLPLTPEQASALADELRQDADSTTPEGRAAQRAADHLDAAAGNEPDATRRPEPGTVGTVGVGDTIVLPDEQDQNTMTAYRVVEIEDLAGGVRVLTMEDEHGQRSQRAVPASDALYQLPEPDAPPAEAPDAEQRDPNPRPDADRIRNDYAAAVVRAVIDSAIQGTSTPGSIHQLRQQIAERLTPQALRPAMRQARAAARTAISDAGFTGADLDAMVRSLRPEAARARTAAIRAAVRTLNDLEPLDGESEDDTARRAADLLRLIPHALRNRSRTDRDGEDSAADEAVAQHADPAVGEALREAIAGGELTEQRRAALVARLAERMAASQDAAAQRIAATVPPGRRPGILAHIVAALIAIARKIIALVAAFLKALAKAFRKGRGAVRRLRERVARFRQGLLQRLRSWPETLRLRRLAAATDLPQHADGLPLGDRIAHWTRMLPAPGRFGQVSRRARWYRPASRLSLATGQLPPVRDGVRWTMDRAVDGGPGPQALRHLAAVRAAGQDVDANVAAVLTAAAPELGADPHGSVRHAADVANNAERRLRDLEAAAAGGADADLEIAVARIEAQFARQEASRLQQAYAAAIPEAVRGVLADVREMGPGTTATLVTTPDSDPAAVRALTDIAQFVPRDWLSPTEARFMAVRSGDAGAYDAANRTATVADLGDGGRRTAAHALLAHLQQHYPDLLAAQEAFHFTRTHSGRVGARRRTPLDQLLARLFGNRAHRGRTDDIVPLGLATLFSGDWYEDDDLRAFLLGLLATR